jgi:hypothetical protein
MENPHPDERLGQGKWRLSRFNYQAISSLYEALEKIK